MEELGQNLIGWIQERMGVVVPEIIYRQFLELCCKSKNMRLLGDVGSWDFFPFKMGGIAARLYILGNDPIK